MEILELKGDDDRLYAAVARLVMDKDVLSYNLNYPFRTDGNFRWFIARENSEAIGFVPVKITKSQAVINNYYAAEDDSRLLEQMLSSVIGSLSDGFELEAVCHTRHIRQFEHCGFSVVHYWKRYAKMKIYSDGDERL